MYVKSSDEAPLNFYILKNFDSRFLFVSQIIKHNNPADKAGLSLLFIITQILTEIFIPHHIDSASNKKLS